MTARFSVEDLGVTEPGHAPELDLIADLAAHRLNVESAAVSFLDPARGCLAVRRGGPGLAGGFDRTPLEIALCRRVLDAAAPVAFASVERTADPGLARLRAKGFRAYLGHPILGPADDPVGVVAALSRAPRIWSREDRRLLAGLAELAGSQILLRASLRTVASLGRELARRDEDEDAGGDGTGGGADADG